ncbi:glycosyltransferase family 2 protein [Loktanella salsilacus]|uniref:glycosyltransferase family 2 protein n=1 Tax=Loktanella salsilacus TaxID=195913 RepID=UPI003703F594
MRMQMIEARAEHPVRISVVIPHLNQPVMLERCLKSLKAGRRQPDEIIVVDNGSQSMPSDICNGFSKVRLLKETQPGPGPARNLGVAASVGDVLAFIDADCLADPDWLTTAEQAMSDPRAEILGGDVRIAYVDPAHLTTLEAYESIYAYRMDRYIAREGFTGTGNLVVRRAVLQDVGPFAGIGIAEDIDWGKRATGSGFTIRFVPKMRVYHPARVHFNELKSKWDRHIAHAFEAGGNGAKGRLLWAAKTIALMLSPVYEIPQVLASDRIKGPSSRLRALLGLTRVRFYRARVMAWLLFGGDASILSGRWNRAGMETTKAKPKNSFLS